MLLTQLEIKNFRGIEQLSLPLDEFCVLIGENNAGKSSVLDALRICLTRGLTRRAPAFDEYDYHLTEPAAAPSKAKPIAITLTFAEKKEDEWPDEISQLLADAEQVDDDGLRSIRLRVTSSYDSAINDFATDYEFLDLSGNALIKAKNPRQLINLQQLVPTFYLASMRDAAQEFRAKSQFWAPFVRALDLDDKVRAELEAALQEVNQKVLAQHTAFDSIKERLKKTAEMVPLGDKDPVSIEAVPSKVFDILSRTQVNLASRTGARIPIVRHGSGTQSLAVVCLFDAFLQTQLEDRYGKQAQPLLALEEPEAHLHPSAIRSVTAMLRGLSGQKLVSTHSGDLLSSVPLKYIRRLSRKNGKVTVHRVSDGSLTADEIAKIDYHVRASRGSLLFSRCWLLVEGETEGPLLSECARAMGYDLYADGVSCIEFAQVGVEKFIKCADQLGIEWFVLADNDPAGKVYEKSALDQLGTRKAADHVRVLDHGAMELFLCMEGFGDLYELNISPQKMANVVAQKGTIDYWRQVVDAQTKNSKPRNAISVAERLIKLGKAGVPKLLQEVVERARTLARSAG